MASPELFGVTSQCQSEEVVEAIVNGAARSIEPKEQVRRLCSIAGVEEEPARKTVTELLSQSSVGPHVSRTPDDRGGKSIIFDLVMDKVPGERWDFLQTDHRKKCWIRMKAEDLGW